MLGTPAYISPEQLRVSDSDARTDIWSLGAILYEIIAGRPPFSDEHGRTLGDAIVNEQPEHLTLVRAGAPPKLDWIVDRALAKNPDERYSGWKNC